MSEEFSRFDDTDAPGRAENLQACDPQSRKKVNFSNSFLYFETVLCFSVLILLFDCSFTSQSLQRMIETRSS